MTLAVATEPPGQLLTVRDWLRYAVTRFGEAQLAFGHGTANAWDEAVWLVLATLHLPLERLEPFLDARLLPEETARLAAALHRRVEDRVPTAYITGEAWLAGHRFRVDERVIVPRSYIAELLSEGLAPWVADPEQVSDALDLCTGSGCLAVLLALAFPNAAVDAADLSAPALEVARANVEDYALGARVRLHRGDLFEALGKRRYDVIVTNPPYVDADAMAQLPAEYLHEPALALAGGVDGLDVVRRILSEARSRLKPGGVLVAEIGGQREPLEAAFPELPFTWPELSDGEASVFVLEREALPS